jgi:hypothetical protein
MSDRMEEVAVETAVEAVDRYSRWGDMAKHIVNEFDKRYYGNWQCIVGDGFGCYLSYDPNCYIDFYVGETNFFLFRERR